MIRRIASALWDVAVAVLLVASILTAMAEIDDHDARQTVQR
jgi:hypothetical protein